MRPPDLPGGNLTLIEHQLPGCSGTDRASMRPPDLPGGNRRRRICHHASPNSAASMRPPDLPGGNPMASPAI